MIDKDLMERAGKYCRKIYGGSWFTEHIENVARFAQEMRDEEWKRRDEEVIEQRKRNLELEKWASDRNEMAKHFKNKLEVESQLADELANNMRQFLFLIYPYIKNIQDKQILEIGMDIEQQLRQIESRNEAHRKAREK